MIQTLTADRRSLALGALSGLVAAGAVLLLPGADLLKGLMIGFLLTSLGWMLYVVAALGNYAATVGSWGEDFTRELIDDQRPRWLAVHDLPLDRRNVDHVVMTPKAVLAIETKYIGKGRDWEAIDAERDLRQAARNATATAAIIRQGLTRVDVRVTPVLMLWGPGTPRWASHSRWQNDVCVVQGRRANDWAKQWAEGPVTREMAELIHTALSAFQAKRDDYDDRTARPS